LKASFQRRSARGICEQVGSVQPLTDVGGHSIQSGSSILSLSAGDSHIAVDCSPQASQAAGLGLLEWLQLVPMVCHDRRSKLGHRGTRVWWRCLIRPARPSKPGLDVMRHASAARDRRVSSTHRRLRRRGHGLAAVAGVVITSGLVGIAKRLAAVEAGAWTKNTESPPALRSPQSLASQPAILAEIQSTRIAGFVAVLSSCLRRAAASSRRPVRPVQPLTDRSGPSATEDRRQRRDRR
jgi:hypothetical protein